MYRVVRLVEIVDDAILDHLIRLELILEDAGGDDSVLDYADVDSGVRSSDTE